MDHFYEKTDSTNLQAKKLAEQGAMNGTTVWALEQTAGRGRLGKEWLSVAGKGLYASCIFRPAIDFAEYAKSTLVAGVAVARFLRKKLADAESDRELALKWPNDILVGGQKIAGILAEAAPPDGGRHTPYLVLGVGLNVLHQRSDFPLAIRPHATSLYLETGKSLELESLLVGLKESLLTSIGYFERGCFPQLLAEWRTMDYLYGKKMECVTIKGEVVTGVSLGPDDDGVLHIVDNNGRRHEILSGDLRLAAGGKGEGRIA